FSVSRSFCQTVRLSHSINNEEGKYVTLRKTQIKKWLKGQGFNCELDVPNIALLGSGGGERAAVGMLGSLRQLGQDNLLGSLLYMCGVSGTTWCMSSLYSDPDWSLNKRCDEVIKTLKGPTVNLSKAVEWLKLRKEENQDFNLTDFWGAFTASYFMKEVSMHTRCLSEDAHITNPYPIYSAIELDCRKQDDTKGVWFEMTPYESGFSGLGAFIPTSCLGSKFEGGALIEKRKEMDMVLLQGSDVSLQNSSFLGWFSLSLSPLSPPISLTPPPSLCTPPLSLSLSTHPPTLPLSLSTPSLSVPPPLSIFTDTNVLSSMASKEKIHLVDAGLKFNSPYLPVLRTSRDVDLIISLDFSEGDPFETVFSAKKYALQQKLPFPPVKESVREEKDHPQGCYVFEGQNTPTVMHMPLFNLQNCQGQFHTQAQSGPRTGSIRTAGPECKKFYMIIIIFYTRVTNWLVARNKKGDNAEIMEYKNIFIN
uniref:PLA2c domain-containing protein n=1 Tax=Oncorhynchus mykiss TaxID=8022 RepID=A0A8C7PQE0_ONCMY